MAVAGEAVASVAVNVSSSYRVKFQRRAFLDLVAIAKPMVIYHVRRMHFFAYDGFVVYTFECEDRDFSQRVLEAIEFSNQPWAELADADENGLRGRRRESRRGDRRRDDPGPALNAPVKQRATGRGAMGHAPPC